MNQHLSSRQISEWVLGERSPEAQQHARGCAACQAEVTRLEEALKLFGGSVRQWSDGQLDTSLPRAQKRSWMTAGSLAWAGVVVMLVVAVTLSVARRPDPPKMADAAVLEQVNKHVSRAVPGPMEPLQKLVQWEKE